MRPFLASIALLSGCTIGMNIGWTDGAVDGGSASADASLDRCAIDDDGDGIPNHLEAAGDPDGDGIPSLQDDDSDADGVLDAAEYDGTCRYLDCDGDGLSNWEEPDSDNDGLRDAREVALGTDVCDIDTDGDRVTDFAEVEGSMTDPLSPSSTIAPGDFFVILPFDGPHERRRLRFDSSITVADIYFLVDTTGSMGETLDDLRASLGDYIVPQVRARIPNAQMGVGEFEDFPFVVIDTEHPIWSSGVGWPGDVPYTHLTDVSDDLALVQAGLDALSLANGFDWPESHVEALYQTATGDGGSWEFLGEGDGARFVVEQREVSVPARRCPSIPDEFEPRRGYPCFRPNALPIVVLATDANFHREYWAIDPATHSFDQAAAAFNALGARFICISINGRLGHVARPDCMEFARATGSVDTDGNPLVYNSEYGAVSRALVDGIETLTHAVPQDVTTRLTNLPPNPDGIDATRFVKSVVAIEGYRDGIAGTGYASRDESTFYGVIPGTMVEFEIDLQNDFRMHQPEPQLFRARITVVGNGRGDLDARTIYILVPGENGTPFFI